MSDLAQASLLLHRDGDRSEAKLTPVCELLHPPQKKGGGEEKEKYRKQRKLRLERERREAKAL